MKIIITGQWIAEIYEQALYEAFLALNCTVIKCPWNIWFAGISKGNSKINFFSKYLYMPFRIQDKYSFGPSVFCLNLHLILLTIYVKPDILFIYRGLHVSPLSLKIIKLVCFNTKIFGYNNDDAFSIKYPRHYWRHFRKSIFQHDHIFCYRQKNIKDLSRYGYNFSSLLRSYYILDKTFPICNRKYIYDVAFVGHYENDGRDNFLYYLIENNVFVNIFGTDWQKSDHYSFFKAAMGREIVPVYGKDYNDIINSSKINLVFLSKLNSDTYTRRCFEIVSTNSFMLSEYTDDLNSLFKQGIEAEYFLNKEELLIKIRHLLINDNLRLSIASNGYQRLLKDKHEIRDRAKEVLSLFQTNQ